MSDFERCAQIAEEYLSTRQLLLAAGEMSAQEIRTAKAVVKLIASRIRREEIVNGKTTRSCSFDSSKTCQDFDLCSNEGCAVHNAKDL
jgi:hypothetical protein